jgi:hypothetical protein
MRASILNIILGLGLMILPTLFNMDHGAANNNYIIGPLVITFSVISLWKINRNAIKANIIFGLWLLASLFIFDFSITLAFLLNGVCGVLLIILSSVKRKTVQKFGGGWRSLFQHYPLHLREAEKSSNKL